MNDINVSCNWHERPCISFADLPESARSDFDYLEESEHFDSRFFRYRGEWYDFNDGFEPVVGGIKSAGFDAAMGTSYFDAIAVKCFDDDGQYMPHEGAIIVGHVHW